MSEEMIEKVARAIEPEAWDAADSGKPMLIKHSIAQTRSLRNARAALSAYNPNERLREALTPSAETKAAYIGEFSFSIEEGEYGSRIIPVPWTTIKEIMAAIKERALSPLPQGEDT